jgi:hypothetical protein
LGGTMLGGAAAGGAVGATVGVAVGVAEGGGILAPIVIASATTDAAMAGIAIGGAGSVGVGAVIVGGMYLANRFGTGGITSSRPGNPALTPKIINVCN